MVTRIELARKVAHHPRIVVTGVERRLGTRYTIDTIKALRRRYSRCRFVLLIGADLMTELPRWRRWQQLLSVVPVAVFDRPGYTRHALASKAALRFHRGRRRSEEARTLVNQTPPAWTFVRIAPHAASATALRARAARKVKSRIPRRRIPHSPQTSSPRRAVAALETGRA
jgi:nicotinate-nucleotide adenylyltransferase